MSSITESLVRQALRGREPRSPEARLVDDTMRLVQLCEGVRGSRSRARARHWLRAYAAASSAVCVWIVWSGPGHTWTPHGLSTLAEWLAPIGCAALLCLERAIDGWIVGGVRLLQSAPPAAGSRGRGEKLS